MEFFRCVLLPPDGTKRKYSLICDDFRLLFVVNGSPSGKVLRQRLSRWVPKEFLENIIKIITANYESIGLIATRLPGINNIVVNPVTNIEMELFPTIINLNDVHGWTRERIADWIESLDEVPVFDIPERESNVKGKLDQITGLVKIKRILQGESKL